MNQSSELELPVSQIVEAYLAGTSGPALARHYGVPQHAIYRLLRNAGVTLRSKGGKDKIYDQGWTQEFVDAYKAGETIEDIARRMGVGKGTIWRALQEQSIPARPHGLRKMTIRVPTSQTVLAYFAGLLDGEGTIQLRYRNRNDWSSLDPRLSICNTHQGVMEWLVAHFGGTVRWEQRPAELGWLPRGVWEIHRARNLHALLLAALPYLVIKRDKAETTLAVLEKLCGLPHTPIPQFASTHEHER